MPARNKEIQDIAGDWILYLHGVRKPTDIAWKLYDLACGRRGEVLAEVKEWVAGMNQGKPAVKKVVEWLDSQRNL